MVFLVLEWTEDVKVCTLQGLNVRPRSCAQPHDVEPTLIVGALSCFMSLLSSRASPPGCRLRLLHIVIEPGHRCSTNHERESVSSHSAYHPRSRSSCTQHGTRYKAVLDLQSFCVPYSCRRRRARSARAACHRVHHASSLVTDVTDSRYPHVHPHLRRVAADWALLHLTPTEFRSR